MSTSWQIPEVANDFINDRRGAIPYGADQLHIMLKLIDQFRPSPHYLVDLGCGDGIAARTVLERHPACRALLIDSSKPMIERARTSMASFGEKVQIREADLNSALWALSIHGSVDLVISAFAIHHLSHSRKKELYGEIHQVLHPGGLFVNIEHVSSPSLELEALFDEGFISEITKRTGRDPEVVRREYHERQDKADNQLLDLETQLSWLREIGFHHVDCIFKWLELVVICGVK